MSENEIKPVAWVDLETWKATCDAGDSFFTDYQDEDTVAVYDQSAIDRLTAEMDRMRIIKSQDSDHISLCHAEIDRLTAERDAAVADAERYRWLRTGDNDEQCLINYPEPDSIEDDTPRAYLLRMDNLDAAIDTARREGE